MLAQVLIQLALAEEHFLTLLTAKYCNSTVGQGMLDVSAAARQNLPTVITDKVLYLFHLDSL